MPRIKSLVDRYPLIFSLAITFLFILLVLISSIVVGKVWTGNTLGWYLGSTISRLASIFILFFIVARLGWLSSAGFTSAGSRQAWLLVLFPLGYAIAVSAFAMTGNFDFSFSDPVLASCAALFLVVQAFLEETAFRGLILHNFVHAWGRTNRGLIRSVIVSSLFYGGYHILYLAGEPLAVVLWRIVVTSLMGILFGALVLRGSSIYPAAFFHGAWNVAGFLNLTRNGVEGTPWSWMSLRLFALPLAVYGLYLLHSLTRLIAHSGHSLSTGSPSP
jgi:membrane protease YdiL (CAAX protease family)